MEQELFEVADLGLHCLAWQTDVKPGYEGEDSRDPAKAVDNQDTKGISKNLRSNAVMNGSTGEKNNDSCAVGLTKPIEVAQDISELEENTKLKHCCEEEADEEADVFLDAEVGDDQTKVQQEHVFEIDAQRLQPEDKEKSNHRLFKFQPLVAKERDEESEKLFIVQTLEDKEKVQDRVIDLMKTQDQNHVNNSDENSRNNIGCEDRKLDVYRDIEIEDLEAEKENVGENMFEVENYLKENSSLMSKIQLKGGQKKLQDATKIDSYEEIII